MPFGGDHEKWELYNIEKDFSQGDNLASEFPEKLKTLQELFDQEARKYNVYPLDDNTTMRGMPQNRPSLIDGRTKFTYFRENVRMPELSIVNLKNTSFGMTAHLEIPKNGAQGVVACQGGSMAGWSLYVKDSKPVYFYNYLGREMFVVQSLKELPAGNVTLKLAFNYDGGGLGKGGTATLYVNNEQVAQGRIERTIPFIFSMSGETFDIGEDTGAPVGPYKHGFPFTGAIKKVEIQLLAELDKQSKKAMHHGQTDAALSSQ